MTEATMPGQTGSQNAQAIPLREEVSGDAARLAQSAKDRIDQAADGKKQTVTKAAHSTSTAIQRAVDELRQDDGAPDWLAKAFETAAHRIEDLANAVEGKNTQDLRRDVSQFARQNPMAFLAASAAAGFAAARFLRAGSEYKSHHTGGSTGSEGEQFSSQSPTRQTDTDSSSVSGFDSTTTPSFGTATAPEFTS